MREQVLIQVRYSMPTDYGDYSDAIYYTPDQWKNIKQDDIDAEKQKRVNAYLDVVHNPPIVKEPTKEDLERDIAVIDKQKAELQSKLDALIAKPKDVIKDE